VSGEYLPGEVVDQCRDLLRQGERLEVLAGRVRLPADVLESLVMLHTPRVRVAVVDSGEIDLWCGCDRLEELL
jgi:hypothetical protein